MSKAVSVCGDECAHLRFPGGSPDTASASGIAGWVVWIAAALSLLAFGLALDRDMRTYRTGSLPSAAAE
jgi:hypothetical protein